MKLGKLEKNPSWGGKRRGSGRPKGSIDETTRVKLEALENYQNRVMLHSDELFNSQYALAKGATYLIRIDEVGEGKQRKKKHVIVTDPVEIREYLDGEDNGNYYYITTKDPDNRALDSLLDRTFGKAAQSVALTAPGGGPLKLEVSLTNLKKLSDDELEEAASKI